MILREFKNYSLIGILNTLIHTFIFIIASIYCPSSWANLLAFIFATTFSFFANAHFTFKKVASLKCYCFFVLLMSLMALLTGWLIDFLKFPKIFSVLLFIPLSWILGFLIVKKLVFREE